MELWEKTISQVLREKAAAFPDRIAYSFDDADYTWADMDRITDAVT